MWKLLLGFVVFAVIAVFVLMKTGADVDMGGEKHGVDASHEAASQPAAAASPAAPAEASAPASAASM
jgi:hypothetical protein